MARRLAPFVLIGFIVLGWLLAGTRSFAQDAQDATSREGHPLVGSWLVTVPNAPGVPPSLYTFGADGTVVGASADGARHGSWEATSETAGDFVVVGLSGPGSAVIGLVRFRGALGVDDSGDSFVLTYEAEAIAPNGAVSAPEGPFTIQGTRIAVIPAAQGTPEAGASTAPPEGTPMVGEVIATSLATALPDGTPVVGEATATAPTTAPSVGTPVVGEVIATSLATALPDGTPLTTR